MLREGRRGNFLPGEKILGKTHRDIGHSYFRKPKGHKQAKVGEARKAPPNAWDDIPYSGMDEAIKPAMRMVMKCKGKKWDEVKAQLSAKHKAGVVSWIEGYVDRNRMSCGQFPRKSPYVDEDGILR